MCAINGLYAYRDQAPAVDPAELCATRDHMATRGPDGEGAWYSPDGRVGLGHRRLAIIDLSPAAAQPMASADGQLHLTFNGEIYNHRALRRELQAQGCVFRTHSDTEVILHLYARRHPDQGPAWVQALRGMYAFALWDAQRRRLLLARDPYGIKPLYYTDDGRTLRFASQVKALLAGGALHPARDLAGEAGFYLFGSVPEPYTLYQGLHALPAGSTLTSDARGPGTPIVHHGIAQVFADAKAGLDPVSPITAPSPQPSPARGEGARSQTAPSPQPSPARGEGASSQTAPSPQPSPRAGGGSKKPDCPLSPTLPRAGGGSRKPDCPLFTPLPPRGGGAGGEGAPPPNRPPKHRPPPPGSRRPRRRLPLRRRRLRRPGRPDARRRPAGHHHRHPGL